MQLCLNGPGKHLSDKAAASQQNELPIQTSNSFKKTATTSTHSNDPDIRQDLPSLNEPPDLSV